MLGTKICVIVAAATLAFTAPMPVDAHGFLTKPAPTFNGYGGGYCAVIKSSVLDEPEGMHFDWGPDENAKAFDVAFKTTNQSLKSFILKHQDTSVFSDGPPISAECGYSNSSGTAQSLPAELVWEPKFVHPGPCEGWCDDEIVLPYTANCWKTFASGVIPYAKDKCAGKNRFSFYWLGVQNLEWQVYINCVPLSGASNSSASTPTTSPAAPKPTAVPATTSKPASASPTSTPTTATTTSAPIKPAPSSAGKGCMRKPDPRRG